MTKLEIAAIYAGVNLILLLVLAVRVTMARRAQRVSFGDGGNPIVTRAMRAHGNAAEYIPAAVGALLFLALLDPVPAWTLHLLGGAFTLGRVSHGYAITTYTGPPPGPGRAFGMILTWASFLGFAIAMIWGATAATL